MDTAPLAVLVETFVASWEREHDDERDRTGRRNPGSRSLRSADGYFTGRFASPLEQGSGVAALAELTARAGQPGIPPATIRRVLRRQYRTTELRIADPLVAAVEHPEVFHNGTLTVRQNPKAAPKDRAACCPGSLTGA